MPAMLRSPRIVRYTGADGLRPRSAGATPVMAQWFAAKADHPDALLFFRMGDFYELFFADAEAAAAALDIALSHRGEHCGTPIPMCGVPQHAAEVYLARLIRRGFRVAVAEQMEDPKTRVGKAPIRREVVRLITPGTITEESLLEAGRPTCCWRLAWDQDGLGAAWLDISTGLFETAALTQAELPDLLGRLEPVEICRPQHFAWRMGRKRAPGHRAIAAADRPPPPGGNVRNCQPGCIRHLQRRRGSRRDDGGGLHPQHPVRRAAQAGSARTARKAGIAGDGRSDTRESGNHRARDGGTLHTLFAAVQRTLTPAGARVLAAWLSAPLTDLAAIVARQDAWSLAAG